MEQPQYLIDTNSVIDYLGKKLPEAGMLFMNSVIDAIPNVSVITKIEVLGFNTTDEHYNLLNDFMNDAAIFELSEEVVNHTISLRKNHKIKLPDVIIAATAIAFNLSLITRNTKDFSGIKGLTAINPWDLSQ
jgi:predicted nucleic acid-binding protein